VQHLEGRVRAPSLGADSVIDYTKLPLPSDGRFDVIFDLALNRPLRVLRKALVPRGYVGARRRRRR